MRDFGRNQTTNSVLLRSVSLVLNRFPRMGMLESPGILLTVSVNAIVNQAGDHKTLSLAQLNIGFHLARRQRRDGESVKGQSRWCNRASTLPA